MCRRRLLVAQLADRRDLRSERSQLALHCGDFLLVLRLGARLFGFFERVGRLRLVEVLATNRGVGKHRDHLGLYLEDATGNENQLLFTTPGRLDAHRAGLDTRDERRVARVNAELARFAGKRDELRLAGEDAFFGADDVDVNGGGGHVRHFPYLMVFAFSNASSMAPSM